MTYLTYMVANWAWLLLGLVFGSIALFAIKLINHRRFYAGLPTPNHTFILGNLETLGKATKRYPVDAHPQAMFTNIGTENNLKGIFYLDLFPFAQSFVVITDPAVAFQIQTSPTVVRHSFANKFLGGLVGTKGLFSTAGPEWQRQRTWFAPAFSMAHLLTLVPGMVEEALVFKENLTRLAVKSKRFRMNDETTKLAIDIIGRTVGDIRLKSQTQDCPILKEFSTTLRWTAAHTDPQWKKIVSPFMMNLHVKKLDKLLGNLIKERFRNKVEDSVDKSILDLAMRGYLKDKGKLGGSKGTRMDLNEEFMHVALDNAKTFFVGGHDTTASMITYMYYNLSLKPSFLARLREEHDRVLGPGLEATLSTLSSSPRLLNNLPLTNATLKEVLRLYPAGFTVKEAHPGTTVTYDGRTYPIDNHMIAILSSAMHRNPANFANPNEFDPDRFLDAETNSSTAWQPFEKGPRNCIGQQLSMLEGKVVAALTLRWFDFEGAFEGTGQEIEGWGGRAYQMVKTTASPKDQIPMRVKLRNE